MTHLDAQVLVPKNHPRIRFRGAMDTLEAELLLCGPETGEILALARRLIRCDVLDEPVGEFTLGGLTQQEQRSHSHFPQKHYGVAHFMPDYADGPEILGLNRCRCAARSAELAAVDAFTDRDGVPTRPDILQALNRMSSMLYILMIRKKASGSRP
jgi:ethanolamine utilization cobalamin adenosyltransferase